MNILHRITVPAVNALFITTALLYMMYLLVKTNQPELYRVTPIPPIQMAYQAPDEEVRTIVNKPPKPTEPEDTPEVPKQTAQIDIDPIENPGWDEPVLRKRGGTLPLPANTQLILALGYPPNYPSRAINGGIEGYAIVGFSVASSGLVYDPFIIESEPGTIFDRASLRAIAKFKYKPRMLDGKPVPSDGQRYKFVYQLDGE